MDKTSVYPSHAGPKSMSRLDCQVYLNLLQAKRVNGCPSNDHCFDVAKGCVIHLKPWGGAANPEKLTTCPWVNKPVNGHFLICTWFDIAKIDEHTRCSSHRPWDPMGGPHSWRHGTARWRSSAGKLSGFLADHWYIATMGWAWDDHHLIQTQYFLDIFFDIFCIDTEKVMPRLSVTDVFKAIHWTIQSFHQDGLPHGECELLGRWRPAPRLVARWCAELVTANPW